jgi:DNA-binding transcriptional MerR regulator
MQKLYYSISEISEMLDEEPYILRYWEKEFEQLNPKKNRGGNRVYSTKDIFLIKSIKKLLRDDKLSIKGAVKQLDLLLKNENPAYFEKEIELDTDQPLLLTNLPKNEKKEEFIKINKKDLIEMVSILKEFKEIIA